MSNSRVYHLIFEEVMHMFVLINFFNLVAWFYPATYSSAKVRQSAIRGWASIQKAWLLLDY